MLKIKTAILLIFISSFSLFPDFNPDKETYNILLKNTESDLKNRYNPDELKAGTSGPDMAAFLVNAVYLNFPDEQIKKILSNIAKMQNLDSSSKNYQNFYWYWGDKTVKDTNAVEFIFQQLIFIKIIFSNNLTKTSLKTLDDILKSAIKGIKSHNVKLSYTNIILMKIWNMISYGETYNDKAVFDEGVKLFNDWIKYTSEYGICEYLSPTYYAIDLKNLGLMQNLLKDKKIKENAGVMLNLFWCDMSANWYAPSLRLGGTHSRDYDRLYGHGQIDPFFDFAGLTGKVKTQQKTPFEYYSYYDPPEKYTQIVNKTPRYTIQKWNDNYALNYTGKNFSIGSSTANYYNMDKTPLVINLGSGEKTAVINFFMDGRGDYYGFKKIMEGSGHMKSLHLKPFISSDQEKNEVLFSASCRDNSEGLTGLESVITLPSDGAYYLNDKKLDVYTFQSMWRQYPKPDNIKTFINTTKNNNETVLEIIDNDENSGVGIYYDFKAVSGKYYKTEAEIKGKNIYLYINWYNSTNKRLDPENNVKAECLENTYTNFIQTEPAPQDAVSGRVWIYSTIKNTTQNYIRDIKFIELDEKNSEKGKVIAQFDFKEMKNEKIEIPLNNNLIIVRDNAAAALRIIDCYDKNGKKTNVYLYNDGLEYGALRLTGTHSVIPTDNIAVISCWAYAEDNIDNENKLNEFINKVVNIKSKSDYTDNILTVEVNGVNKVFKLSSDMERFQKISSTFKIKNILLSVDNIEYGKEILNSIR